MELLSQDQSGEYPWRKNGVETILDGLNGPLGKDMRVDEEADGEVPEGVKDEDREGRRES
eukprot:1910171-Karenia_brevis.AAC.1